MKKLAIITCVSTLLFPQFASAVFYAVNPYYTNMNLNLYVPRSAPNNYFLGTYTIGTYYPWDWNSIPNGIITKVGINLPEKTSLFISGYGYIKEIGNSGIGYALHGEVSSPPCSGSGYVRGNDKGDTNNSNELLCSSRSYGETSNTRVQITLKASFFKINNKTTTMTTLPQVKGAMFILYSNGKFISTDARGRPEPLVYIYGIKAIPTGCEVKNKNIAVPFGPIKKSSFSGVGSNSPDSKKTFQIDLDCVPNLPIKVTFRGTADPSNRPGTIALNDPTNINTAKGYGIEVRYKNEPIKLGQMVTVAPNNTDANYHIPLEASYIQTEEATRAGKANGTLQFDLQYY